MFCGFKVTTADTGVPRVLQAAPFGWWRGNHMLLYLRALNPPPPKCYGLVLLLLLRYSEFGLF